MNAERVTAALFAGMTLAGVGFAVTFALGGNTQLLGTALVLALGCGALAFVVWSKHLMPHELAFDERKELPGPPEDRAEIEASFGGERDPLARRTLLRRMLFLAAGAVGAALLFPLRSFGRNPAPYRDHTAWRNGSRMVRDDGSLVRADDLDIGSILTGFPEGHIEDSDAQTLLIRVEPGVLNLPPDKLAVAPRGYVAYSKVCTHAGCPVGLYRQAAHELLCPCHQSAFDVADGAKPISGPATRPLAQLPIRIDDAGYVVALGDFLEPVGPDSWERP